jgi:hypothetical protein
MNTNVIQPYYPLPFEILLHVFSYIDLSDDSTIQAVQKVSKAFYEVSQHASLNWDRINLFCHSQPRYYSKSSQLELNLFGRDIYMEKERVFHVEIGGTGVIQAPWDGKSFPVRRPVEEDDSDDPFVAVHAFVYAYSNFTEDGHIALARKRSFKNMVIDLYKKEEFILTIDLGKKVSIIHQICLEKDFIAIRGDAKLDHPGRCPPFLDIFLLPNKERLDREAHFAIDLNNLDFIFSDPTSVICFYNYNQTLSIIDIKTKKEKTFPYFFDILWGMGEIPSLSIVDGKIFAATDDGKITFLNMQTGEVGAINRITPEGALESCGADCMLISNQKAVVLGESTHWESRTYIELYDLKDGRLLSHFFHQGNITSLFFHRHFLAANFHKNRVDQAIVWCPFLPKIEIEIDAQKQQEPTFPIDIPDRVTIPVSKPPTKGEVDVEEAGCCSCFYSFCAWFKWLFHKIFN